MSRSGRDEGLGTKPQAELLDTSGSDPLRHRGRGLHGDSRSTEPRVTTSGDEGPPGGRGFSGPVVHQPGGCDARHLDIGASSLEYERC